MLAVNNSAQSGEQWVANACLYSKGLSPHDCEAIPWNGPSKVPRVEGDVLPHIFTDPNVRWLKFT